MGVDCPTDCPVSVDVFALYLYMCSSSCLIATLGGGGQILCLSCNLQPLELELFKLNLQLASRARRTGASGEALGVRVGG